VTQDDPEVSVKHASFSTEFSEFLIELSIGVHRYAMYPSGHPSHDPVLENIVGRLAELFIDRTSISIGVAAKQLIIEGMATDQKHPVLSDLAKRLHEHQLGAVSFKVGVTASEIAGLLEALAEESARGGTPIGLREGDDFPRWEHARFHQVGYDKLELVDEADPEAPKEMDRATALWLGLAQAALASDEAPAAAPDAATIARSIEGHGRDEAYDQAVVGYMLQLTDELKETTDGESKRVRARVSTLMNELDDKTLTRLVEFGGNSEQRKRFVLDANQSLAVDSVVKVVTAAAATSEQTISSSMTRMLSKLAMHASGSTGEAGSRSHADTALRENVESLIEGWELKDPNPEAYTTVLDAMATSAPEFSAPDNADNITGVVRLVQMALEVDAYGPTISKAVQDMAADGGTGQLMEMIATVGEGNAAATTIKTVSHEPRAVSRVARRRRTGHDRGKCIGGRDGGHGGRPAHGRTRRLRVPLGPASYLRRARRLRCVRRATSGGAPGRRPMVCHQESAGASATPREYSCGVRPQAVPRARRSPRAARGPTARDAPRKRAPGPVARHRIRR